MGGIKEAKEEFLFINKRKRKNFFKPVQLHSALLGFI
jgi:hypothetical protein